MRRIYVLIAFPSCAACRTVRDGRSVEASVGWSHAAVHLPLPDAMG